MKEIKLGKYQHHKGDFYEVIGVGRHSETLEEIVVYRAFYGSEKFGKNALWVRPKSMFTDKVIVDGEKVLRFKYIDK